MNLIPTADMDAIVQTMRQVVPGNMPYSVVAISHKVFPDLEKLGMKDCAYTVGMGMVNKPDVIVTGLGAMHLSQIVLTVAEHIRTVEVLEDGWVDRELKFGNLPILIRYLKPHQHAAITEVASKFYATNRIWPAYVQIVLPDPNGRLPGEEGYSDAYMRDKYGQINLWENKLDEFLSAQPRD